MQWFYQNGDLVPADEAAVSVNDPAVFHGRALIETFAARGGRVFRLAEHYDRLYTGGLALDIAIPPSVEEIELAVKSVLERNQIREARMRLVVTQKTVTLAASPLTDYPPELYKRGLHATIADVRRNETSPLSRIKCAAGLLDGLLAREAARKAGFDDAILLNTQGSVACGAVANVFAVYHGRIMTPLVGSGALPGITRGALLSIAREEGIEATEADFSVRELAGADEAFLTNSIMGVMPLTKLENEAIPSGRVTARLREALHRAASGE